MTRTRSLRLLGTLLAATLLPLPALAQADRNLAWKTGKEAAEIERKVENLLRQMTLEEKIGQLHLTGQDENFNPFILRTGRSGMIMNVFRPVYVRAVQELAAQSRLKIPPLLGLDAIHGYATLFPQPVSQAATFDPKLIEVSAYWTAVESRAAGINWTFAPMVDMTRDPRWGRVLEGAGEDAHMAAVSAAARVRGYHRGGLVTTVKHFVGYGESEGGRDYNSVYLPKSKLYDYHLPAYKAALEAGAFSVMTSISALNGVAPVGNKYLITDLLKGEMKFKGFVVSDFAAIGELVNHGMAAEPVEATRKAILAGIDVDMFADRFYRHLATEVKEGRVPMSRVDDAVRRVLRVKFHAGLFEAPMVEPDKTASRLLTPEARAASLSVAREAIILLQNDKNILPISKDVKSIAVIGQLGLEGKDWTYSSTVDMPVLTRPPLDKELAKILGDGVKISAEPGVKDTCGTKWADREAAKKLASQSDLIIAVLGEDCEYIGESASRTELDLFGVQPQLLEDLIATGKPVVLFVKSARPLILTPYVNRVAAVVQAFYLGSEARTAMAEMLTGKINPSGKLPMSMPRNVGQIPVYYDHLPSARPPERHVRYESIYIDQPNTPLFPFGFGLSYTRFAVSDLKLAATSLPRTGTLKGSVVLANLTEREGREVVQVYIHQRVGSRSRPVRQLKAFEKVLLAGNARQEVAFAVPVQSLGFHDDDGKYHVEPGVYDVYVGTDSNATLTTTFTVK